MDILSAVPFQILADATMASNAMRAFLAPVMTTLIALASVAVVIFLVHGGIQYMTSSGNPEKLDHAKLIIKNALIGLLLIIVAATLTAILAHAYSSSGPPTTSQIPQLVTIEPNNPGGGVVQAIIDALIGVSRNIIATIGIPFLAALEYFTKSTPLMADNAGVANLWLGMVGICDALFVLVVVLIGFHVMSMTSFGFDEIEFKHLLPRLVAVFLLMNTSIFAIDGIISLSNGMIHAINVGFPTLSVWGTLKEIVDKNSIGSLAGLLLMLAFMILTVILLVYYVLRLVVLYIGAVLSPAVVLVWLVPGYRDFAESAVKSYIGVIFVLFIHTIILQLSASIFTGMAASDASNMLNPFMSVIVGIATILALLKTQQVLLQLSMMSSGARTAKKAVGTVINVIRSKQGKATDNSAASSKSKGDVFPTKNTNTTTKAGLPNSLPKISSTNAKAAQNRTQEIGKTKRAPKYYSDTPRTTEEDYPSSVSKPIKQRSKQSKKGSNTL